MKQYLLSNSSAFSNIESLYSGEIIERLAALNGQHLALTEKLRELHNKKSHPTAGVQFKWLDLKTSVASLRSELEGLEQIF